MNSKSFVDWDSQVLPFPRVQQEWEVSSLELASLFPEEGGMSESKRVSSSTSCGQTISSEDYDEDESCDNKQALKKKRKAERNKRMAEACKRFREKRRKEVEELREKNAGLESQRELYLQRIADLQTEAQMLRDEGTVDLGKENDLLRAEISKHKQFLEMILSAVKSAPVMTEEEKVRVLQEGVGSSVGQALGLCYTSTVDPSWRSLMPMTRLGKTVHLSCQYLPFGCTPETAKRGNYRIDFPNVKGSMEALVGRLWETWVDESAMKLILKQNMGDFLSISDLSISEVFPEASLDNIRIFRFVETYKKQERLPADLLVVTSVKDVSVNVSALPPNVVGFETKDQQGDGYMGRDVIKSKILVCSSSSSAQKVHEAVSPREPGVSRIDFPAIMSYLVIPVSADICHVVNLGSMPLRRDGFFGVSNEHGPLVNEAGQLNPHGSNLLDFVTCFVHGILPPPTKPPDDDH